MRSLAVLALVGAVLAGCGSSPSEVKVGMSEQQVKEVLGEPIASMQERSVSVQTVMIYERITVYLEHGAVTKVETK